MNTSDTAPRPEQTTPADSPHHEHVARAAGRGPGPGNLAIVCGATVVTLLTVIFVVRDLAHQPVLVTSLASSSFLLYYQPLNEVNRFKPLVFSHAIAVAIGYACSHLLPLPYASAAVSLGLTVAALGLLRLVHPPAVSTSLVFSYTPHDASVAATFLLALVVVIALCVVYIALNRGVRFSRWARHFGFPEPETWGPG